MTEPSAKIIADSISPAGHRLTTMEIVMHRFVLAEFNTHRVFSRNSASSRAIPLSVTLKQVEEDPALPISWPSEKPGMSGGAELEGDDLYDAKQLLRDLRADAVALISLYNTAHPEPAHRLHKSVLNRYLEPFRWHVVVCTSTEWSNFFTQRVSPLAQPEMRVVAEAMEEAYNFNQPNIVGHGGWHLPYVGEEDWAEVVKMTGGNKDLRFANEEQALLRQISAARCARVSRERQGGNDIEADLKVYEILKNPGEGPPHASPLEHVATPCPGPLEQNRLMGAPHNHLGNFTGFDQLRHKVLGF